MIRWSATPQEEGTHHRAHTSLPGEPYRAHAELRPRQQEEAGRRKKKLTRGSLLRHQEKQSPLGVCVCVCDLRPHISSAPRCRTWLSPSGSPRKLSPQPLLRRSGRFWAPGFHFSNWSPGKKKKKTKKKKRAKVGGSDRGEQAAVSSRWMAVIQKYGKSYSPDLVCDKENHPPDKIAAAGSYKKRAETSTYWPRWEGCWWVGGCVKMPSVEVRKCVQWRCLKEEGFFGTNLMVRRQNVSDGF